MRINKITIAGLLCFDKQVELDLAAIPAGLIAVTGDNGAGKTTLMEAPLAALYRQFPSRQGRPLFDYAHGQGWLELAFGMNGSDYVARVSLDARARTTEAVMSEAFLIKTPPSVNMGLDPLTDGKVTTYDAWVRKNLPSLPVMLASAFSCQNRRGSFITLDRKGRKDLFAELLGLERYAGWAQIARDQQATHQGTVIASEAHIDAHCEAGPFDDVALALFEEQLGQLKVHIPARQSRIDKLGATIKRTEAAIKEQSAEVHRHLVATASVIATKALLATIDADVLIEVGRESLAKRAFTREREEINNTRDTMLALLVDRRKPYLAALEHQAEIDLAVSDTAHQERILVRFVPAVREGQQRLNVAREALRVGELAVAQYVTKVDAVALARIGSEILETVPCRGQEAYAGCRFLARAARNKDQLPGMEAELGDKPDMAPLVDEVKRADRHTLDAEVFVDVAEARIATLRPLVDQQEALTVARERLASLKGEGDREHEHAAEARAGVDARQAADVKVSDDRHARCTKSKDTSEAELVELQAVAIATAGAQEVSEALTTKLGAQREDLEHHTARLARLQGELARVEENLHQVVKRRAQIDQLRAGMTAAQAEASEWGFLAKCFGRDGLPVLEIANAGPGVSTLCNQLLESCFGARFTVQFVTQEAKVAASKDGSQFKEAFTIHILDHQHGGERRDIADLSGGEQIIVDEVLKNAIAIYSNQRSQTPIETCWRDETTGPLDTDNRERYLTMLRTVLEIGHFHHVLFVTHSPDAAARADTQVVLRHGMVEVML